MDVLIAPSMPTPAFGIGELVDPLPQYLADVNTVPVDLAGVPPVSVPCGEHAWPSDRDADHRVVL